MKHHPSDAALFAYVAAMLAGLMLAFLAVGGCSSVRAASRATPTPEWSDGRACKGCAAPRGPILIRVRIVDTDPSDDVSLSFVFLCSRIVRLMRGAGVQL
jgi:hypothetical protein